MKGSLEINGGIALCITRTPAAGIAFRAEQDYQCRHRVTQFDTGLFTISTDLTFDVSGVSKQMRVVAVRLHAKGVP